MNRKKIYTNPAFASYQEMQQLCQGLFLRFDLNAFSFSRIYTDGSRAELWTDPNALDHSFFLKKHIKKVYTPNLFGEQKFVLYDIAVQSFPVETKERIYNQLQDQKELFNHANCLFLIEHENEYTEYFAFYTSATQNNAVNNYLNNRDCLERFVKYFRKRAKGLILEADKKRLISPWLNLPSSKPICSEKIQPNNVINITNSVQLTKREKEIGDLLCEGFTAKESADMLCISYKTVEKHVENIKMKLGCNRRAKLVHYLLSQNHEE